MFPGRCFQRPSAHWFGFNQFQVYNRPYLADRSTELRLESIRGYVHHNSFLSLLVDLGLVGFVLYMAVLVAFCKNLATMVYTAGTIMGARRGDNRALALSACICCKWRFTKCLSRRSRIPFSSELGEWWQLAIASLQVGRNKKTGQA